MGRGFTQLTRPDLISDASSLGGLGKLLLSLSQLPGLENGGMHMLAGLQAASEQGGKDQPGAWSTGVGVPSSPLGVGLGEVHLG